MYQQQEITRQVYRQEWLAYERGMATLSLEQRTDIDLNRARALLADFGSLWLQLTTLEQKEIAQSLLDVGIIENQRIIEWRWYASFTSLFEPV